MQILYFQYQPREHFYAHLLEHCFHDILIREYRAKILSAKTGLGYSEVAFESAPKIKNIENLFEKIDKNVFKKHHKLVLSEIWQKGRVFFVLTNLMEYGCNSVFELDKIKKDLYKVSYKKFISFCKKTFSLRLAENLQDVENIETTIRQFSKPRIDFKSSKKQLKNMAIIEYGWFIPVKNVAEAIVLSWFRESFLKYMNHIVFDKGISYNAEGILHKPLGNWLFVNLSIVADRIAPIKLLPKLTSSEFSKKKQEFIKEFKKNTKFDLKDAFYQKMDWGDYMTAKEIISYIQKIPYSRWSRMFSEKSAKHKITAAFDFA